MNTISDLPVLAEQCTILQVPGDALGDYRWGVENLRSAYELPTPFVTGKGDLQMTLTFVDKSMVGYMAMRPHVMADDMLYVSGICLDEDYRGHGVAERMMASGLEEFPGMQRVRLFPVSRAINFYDRLGFEMQDDGIMIAQIPVLQERLALAAAK